MWKCVEKHQWDLSINLIRRKDLRDFIFAKGLRNNSKIQELANFVADIFNTHVFTHFLDSVYLNHLVYHFYIYFEIVSVFEVNLVCGFCSLAWNVSTRMTSPENQHTHTQQKYNHRRRDLWQCITRRSLKTYQSTFNILQKTVWLELYSSIWYRALTRSIFAGVRFSVYSRGREY